MELNDEYGRIDLICKVDELSWISSGPPLGNCSQLSQEILKTINKQLFFAVSVKNTHRASRE